MLACARLGAVHSVVFGGFAAQELARRIEHAEVQLNFCFYCFYFCKLGSTYNPFIKRTQISYIRVIITLKTKKKNEYS